MSKFDMLSDSDIRIEKAEAESKANDSIASVVNSDIRVEDTLTISSASFSMLNPNIRNNVFYSIYMSMPTQIDISSAMEHYTLGVEGQSIFNGNMTVNGSFRVNGDSTANGDLNVNGNLNVHRGDLNLQGDIIIMGTRLTQNQLARLIDLII